MCEPPPAKQMRFSARTNHSAEGLYSMPDVRACLLEIGRNHGGRTFNTRIKRQKPSLADRGDLRSIFHVHDQDCRPLSAVNNEVSRFRLLLCENLLDRFETVFFEDLS
jgi:hypothetical protein